MSALAKEAREKARSKAERLVRSDPKTPVDASGYSPPGPMNADVQTGPRPVSRFKYRSGGTVLGNALRARADRKPRATGGRALVDDFLNRDVKEANAKLPGGGQHDGGFKRGGRAFGGMAPQPMGSPRPMPGLAPRPMRASGGKVHKDEAQDRALIHKMGCQCERCSGGRVGRKSGGGNWIAGAIKHPGALHKELHVPEGKKIPEKKLAKASHSDNPTLAKRANLAKTLGKMHKASGGSTSVSDGALEGTRPKGGRLARKGGGRAKKGMNVNIIIAPSSPKPAMMPPPGGSPPPGAGPVGLHQGVPPPQMPPPGAPPPMGAAPMMRKDGGAVVGHLAKPGKYPIKDGSGGAKGRLEKARAYG